MFLCFESFGDELWKGGLLPLLLLAEALGFLLPLAAVVYSSGRVFWTLARPDATRSQRRRKTVRLPAGEPGHLPAVLRALQRHAGRVRAATR